MKKGCVFLKIKKSILRTIIMLGLCLSLIFVTACSSSGTTKPAASDSKVELTFWSWVPEPAQWDELVKAFNAKHPNITVTYTRDVKADYEKKLKVAV